MNAMWSRMTFVSLSYFKFQSISLSSRMWCSRLCNIICILCKFPRFLSWPFQAIFYYTEAGGLRFISVLIPLTLGRIPVGSFSTCQLFLWSAKKAARVERQEKFSFPFLSTSRDIKVEGLNMASIFLVLFHVHESVCRGRRKPKGNSFIKKKAIISPKLMPTFHFLV